MNRKHRLRTMPRVACVLAAAWIVTLAPAATATTPPEADPDATSDSDDGHVIELRVEDGKTTVLMDGREIPESRIRHEGGRVVIVDKDGNEIDTFQLHFAGGDGMIFDAGRNRFFGPEQNQWQDAMRDFPFAEAPPSPKVMIGIHLGAPGAALEHHLRLDSGSATMITGIYEGLPAHEAGLREYDVIVAVDGESPADPDTLRKLLAEKDVDAKVQLRVIQKGEPHSVTVKLIAYDAEMLAEAGFLGTQQGPDVIDLEHLGGPGGPGVFWTLPGNRRALIAPGTDDVFIGVPDIDARIRTQIERKLPQFRAHTGHAPAGHEEQIDRLERRLEELTERLNQLLEDRDR